MFGSIIMISRNRIKQGKAEEFARHYLDSVPHVEANKPGTLLQSAYTNKEVTELVILRVFEDGQAMDAHLDGADQRSPAAYQFIEPTAVEIYGSPSAKSIAIIRAVVGGNVCISDYPEAIGGLIRFDSN
jgi:quinol monooxygenase YgiN